MTLATAKARANEKFRIQASLTIVTNDHQYICTAKASDIAIPLTLGSYTNGGFLLVAMPKRSEDKRSLKHLKFQLLSLATKDKDN
jgi:hypothetical protein